MPASRRPARLALAAVTAAVALTITACGTDAPDRPAGTAVTVTPPVPAPSAEPTTAPTPTSEPAPTTEPASVTAPTTAPTPATTGEPAFTSEPSVAPTPVDPWSDGVLTRDETGEAVRAVQTRLTELGYWNGGADGEYGALTGQAVLALQKANGLQRDGVLGPVSRQALLDGARPQARSSSDRVIEIDLDRQLLLVVDDGRVSWVLNTSTGSNDYYTYGGEQHLADTPTGTFTVQRQIDGLRISHLGELWRPKYFNGGIAIHGSPSVPAYPASHGCVRLTDAAMNWLWSNGIAPVGTPVWVY